MRGFQFNEKYLSQIPALQELVNLGYEYLTPERAFKARRKKLGSVLLENTLHSQIKKIHLHRHHDSDFYKLLDRCLPDWIQRKHKLELALV